MTGYDAVFFDQDGTLTMLDRERTSRRDAAIGSIIGQSSFTLSGEESMAVFWRVTR